MRPFVSLAFLLCVTTAALADGVPVKEMGAAARESVDTESPFPAIAADQSRQGRSITVNQVQQADPVPEPCTKTIWNNCSGTTSVCYSDRACRTTDGNLCKEHSGTKCYEYLNTAQEQRCRAC
jgi:hypothetical protein